MRPYNPRQHWNANVRPPPHQQQQQQSARHQPPPRGNQQQNRNANMRPPAQRQQQSAQHPSPPQQPYHYGDGAAENVGDADDVRTLYIGRLQDWMDEDYLNSCFGPDEQLVSARIIHNKQTGQPEGYGFLEFRSHAAAENILQSFDGKKMPDAEQIFKLNWAGPKAKDFKIFVQNLDVSVTDRVLRETFKSEYPSVKSAEVIRDPVTGHSKGFGIVRFGDETERNRSIPQMHGCRIANKCIKTRHASGKTPSSAQPQNASHQNLQGAGDLDYNSRVFVSGLHQEATAEDLKSSFSHFGRVAFVEAPPGQCHGYVQFSDRSSAELVLTRRHRNDIKVLGKPVRLRWWRSDAERQNQSGTSQSGYSRHHRRQNQSGPSQSGYSRGH